MAVKCKMALVVIIVCLLAVLCALMFKKPNQDLGMSDLRRKHSICVIRDPTTLRSKFMADMKPKDYNIKLLWEQYKGTSSGKVSDIEIRDGSVAKIKNLLYRRAILDFRIETIAFFMLGPEDYRSVLYEDGDPAVTLVEEDDVYCLEDTINFFGGMCGPLPDDEPKYINTFANLCLKRTGILYTSIGQAILETCSMKNRRS